MVISYLNLFEITTMITHQNVSIITPYSAILFNFQLVSA